MLDIIKHKRDGGELSAQQIEYFINGYTKGDIPDYQSSALLMAIYFNSMNDAETAALTMSMAASGDTIDLSPIKGVKVDKHSSGGVGDKTTLIITPIVAACGVPVAKMSGRALGHTGGTIDKLEAIPGYKTELSIEKFIDIVSRVGCSVVGQTGQLAPADKLLYALRDVTATVESIPLIAASIMSKKLAAGCDCILLDVKVGSGAFMSTLEQASELAKRMVAIGEHAGKRTVALITDMDSPLGNAVGTSLEVKESVEVLQGKGAADLTELCVALSANMLVLGGKGNLEQCEVLVRNALESGAAFAKLIEMVEAHQGDISVLKDTSKLENASIIHPIYSKGEGFIGSIHTSSIGEAAGILGAGRATKAETIDHCAGVILSAKTGDYVKVGDLLCTLHTNKAEQINSAEEIIQKAYFICEKSPISKPIILDKV